jgi:hypothetical protein
VEAPTAKGGNRLVRKGSSKLSTRPEVPDSVGARQLSSTRVGVWASPPHETFAEGREDWELRWMSAHPESAFCARHSSTGGWSKSGNVAGRGTSSPLGVTEQRFGRCVAQVCVGGSYRAVGFRVSQAIPRGVLGRQAVRLTCWQVVRSSPKPSATLRSR